jgi:hypothetical protein
MAFIVQVMKDGENRWLTRNDITGACVQTNDRGRASHFSSEAAASETAAFRGCGHWKIERVEELALSAGEAHRQDVRFASTAQ